MRYKVVAALITASVAGADVEGGVVVFGRGAAGVTLGMTHAQVTALLGKPNAGSSGPGFASYGGRSSSFDLYFDETKKFVESFGIAGKRFCTASGFCVGDRMQEVLAKYGKAVKKHYAVDERSYKLIGSFRGKATYTVFMVKNGVLAPSSRVPQIFIGYCEGTTYCPAR